MCDSVADDLVFAPLEEEALALNEQDRAWIRETIRESLQGRGWGRVRRIASDWSALAIVVAVLIFAATQWGDYREFRGSVNSQLTEIGRRIGEIEGRIAQQTAVTHSAMPTAEFGATLPELSAALSTLRVKRVSSSGAVLNGIQNKLVDVGTESPGFWPAASELVSYKSQQASQYLLDTQLPDCVDHDPSPSRVLSATANQLTFDLPTYNNCKFTLDSQRDGEIVTSWLKVHPTAIRFDHCLIVYHGGKVSLPTEVEYKEGFSLWSPENPTHTAIYHHPYEVKNPLRFQACAWSVDLQLRPPQFGVELTKALLRSSDLNVDFFPQNVG